MLFAFFFFFNVWVVVNRNERNIRLQRRNCRTLWGR